MRTKKTNQTNPKTKTSKYLAKKVEVDGITFDSKKEARRWCVLKGMEESGEISDLRRQVKFILIPAQREPDTVGARGGIIRGKVIERELAYIADFAYFDNATEKTIVEDVKSGYRDGANYRIYVIKRKLLYERFGIRVKEV